MTRNSSIDNFSDFTGVYCFGFNGKESDSEGMGGGLSTYDYGFRIYNPSLGKFLSVDPLTFDYPWYTPYQFAGNKPIWAIDLDGLEEYFVTDYFDQNGNLYKTVIRVVSFRGGAPGNNLTQAKQSSNIVHTSRVDFTSPTTYTVTYVDTRNAPQNATGNAFSTNQEKQFATGYGTNGVRIFTPTLQTEAIVDPRGNNPQPVSVLSSGESTTVRPGANAAPEFAQIITYTDMAGNLYEGQTFNSQAPTGVPKEGANWFVIDATNAADPNKLYTGTAPTGDQTVPIGTNAVPPLAANRNVTIGTDAGSDIKH